MKKALVVALLLCVSCRSMWQSVKSSAAPAGGAAGGAALGLSGGPIGAIIGAAVGATIAHAIQENASLRSGETVGDGALAAEMKRWQRRAAVAESYVEVAEEGKDWAMRWRWRVMWGAIGFFCFLRRKYLWEAITKHRVVSRFWAFVHAFVGADWTRKRAFGFDPMPKAEKNRKVKHGI